MTKAAYPKWFFDEMERFIAEMKKVVEQARRPFP